jgi:hypothetical protein
MKSSTLLTLSCSVLIIEEDGKYSLTSPFKCHPSLVYQYSGTGATAKLLSMNFCFPNFLLLHLSDENDIEDQIHVS